MPAFVQSWLPIADGYIAASLFPIAILILVSGLDDLFLDFVWLGAWLRRRFRGTVPGVPATLDQKEKRIAIFVPLWHEDVVIGGMIEHNIAAIAYPNYDFFIGAYPNDDPTLDVVRDLESRFPRVHLAVCPHDGPTSKADCLNWIYQRMLLHEETHGIRYDVVVTHDAEDLIHPAALSRINGHADSYDMIQIPVLPLRLPFRNIVHGLYCDEFAEWQIKDMQARILLGSFMPSNGVGTGYTREALEKLAVAEHNLIFEPSCLTEDYENGLRLHQLGCPQIFVPVAGSRDDVMATREYFPRTSRTAVRQRTRWIMGIALQTWERYGWRGNPGQIYWFWRDRKGLFGNPLSLITNAIFLYGFVTWALARWTATPWGLSKQTLHPELLVATLALGLLRVGVRMMCTWRLYGIAFALGVPIRTVCANYINSAATFSALFRYFRARIRNEPLRWVKTEHAYPSRSALSVHKRRLGEILAGSAYIDADDLEQALRSLPAGIRLGEYLVQLGKITPSELYEALSLQQSVPAGRLEPSEIGCNVARALPRHIVRSWKVLPYRISSGSMFLASPEIPTDDLARTLRGFTKLALRFHLVTPENFELLTAALL